MALIEPKVVFNEIEHTYINENGKQLSGVTGLLKRQLFADKYSGISEAVLAQAAERGNLIHRQIEMYETFGEGENLLDEVKAYIQLKEDFGFEIVATEFLVSDEENVASSIDQIFSKDDLLFLCDTKGTSKLDMDYLSWQLSTYKYLFLLKNPKAKIGGLYACWLPRKQYGNPKMVEVPEKPLEWVKELIACDARGEKYENPEKALIEEKEQSLVVPQEITIAIANVLKAEAIAKDCKERLKALMEAHGIKKWECEEFTATIGASSTGTSFDTTAFKAEHKELYEKYLKTTQKKGSFRITLK